MRVSVVLPVHNGEAYLAEAIESVLSNSLPPWELIVVDDGSSDKTPEIAQAYSAVRYVRQQPAGAAQARNLGISLCRGEAVAFLDADDLWSIDKLKLQTALLTSSDLDGVFGGVVQFSQQGQQRVMEAPQQSQLLGCLLARRQVFERVGTFDTGYRLGEFIDWCLRSQECGCRYGSVPEVVLYRRLHGENLGRREKHHRQDYARLVMAAFQRRKANPRSPGDSDCAVSD